MTLSEMNNVTLGFAVSAGTVATGSACSGISGGVPRLGYPGMCFNDAGNGVRSQDGVSAFSSGVSVGASWNAMLAYERGLYMGAEFQRKGINVALGPVVGPIGRVAEGGRNWEVRRTSRKLYRTLLTLWHCRASARTLTLMACLPYQQYKACRRA